MVGVAHVACRYEQVGRIFRRTSPIRRMRCFELVDCTQEFQKPHQILKDLPTLTFGIHTVTTVSVILYLMHLTDTSKSYKHEKK